MGINPLREESISRLRDAMKWSSKKLAPFRTTGMELLRDFVGHHYGENGSQEKTPVNMMKMAIGIYMRKLTARPPKVLVRCNSIELSADAAELEIATNHLLQEIDIRTTLQEAVMSALFTMGIVKIGITSPAMTELAGYLHDGGQPYADAVLFDDWLHDMTARRQEEWGWCGNRYRLPLEEVKQCQLFDPAVRDRLMATNKRTQGGDFDTDSPSHASELSQGDDTMEDDEYQDHVELWDIYLPREGLMLTLPVDGGNKPLRVFEWDGPEKGPYRLLNFTNVLGNVIGSPPAHDLKSLNTLGNKIFTKLADQGLRQKTVTIATGAAASDGTADRTMRAEDGQVIRSDNPEAVKEYKYGGPDQQNMAFSIMIRDMFSYLGGNLNSLGGLRQEGDTATQEKILRESSSELVQDMQDKTYEFAKGVITDLAQYLYTDPFLELPIVKPIEGTSIVLNTVWGPERREADFFQYNLSVEPYSMQPQSPQDLLQALTALTTQMILPMAPMMQAQGLEFNFESFLQLVSKLANMPELAALIRAGGVPLDISGGVQKPIGMKPGSTQRNYVRTSVATGGTGASRDNILMQTLMSGSSQVTPQQSGQMARA